MNRLRAALIVRVSSELQDFERQTADLTALAERMGYTIEGIDDVYAEKLSGTLKADDRPEMARLKKNVSERNKSYDMIFVQEVSRIGREPSDARHTIDFFAEHGIPVYVQNLGQQSIKPDGTRNEIFHIVYTIMAELAKTENDLRVMRSKSGQLNEVRKGHAGGGMMKAYGYKKDENKRLVVDTEEAEVVKQIFQMVLDGYGGKQICHALNKQGIPTRTQKCPPKKGTLKMKNAKIYKNVTDIKWVDGTIDDMLKNPIYKGDRMYKGELIPSPHLRIIETEIWDKVQEVRKDRFDNRVRDTRWLYLCHRLMKCGKCGRNMYGRYKRGGKDCYYQCSSVRDNGCGNGGINIEVLDSCVFHLLRDGVFYNYFKTTANETEAAKSVQRARLDLDHEESKASELSERLRRLHRMFTLGKIQESDWLTQTDKVEREIKVKQETITALKKRIKLLEQQKSRLSEMDGYNRLLFGKEIDRTTVQKIFQTTIERIVVTAAYPTRNNTVHLVTIWLKDNPRVITVLIYAKPKNMSERNFVGDLSFAGAGHGRCYFSVTDNIIDQEIIYDDQYRLTTPTERVVDLFENFHPELYDDSDITEIERSGGWEQWVSVPVRLLKMEEHNIRGAADDPPVKTRKPDRVPLKNQ